eukprot:scaffold75_cov165-Amphora_coffeaeformis.AAC.20
MAIYESTPSSSVLTKISSAVVPTRHRVRVTSQMDSMVSSGSNGGRRSLTFNKTTLGWTACVAISLLIIQIIGSRRDKLTDSDGNESVGSDSGTLYQFVYDQLSRLRDFFISSRNGEDYDKEEDLDGESFVVHQGSCHCGSIAFEVSAPLVLQIEELSGKLLYPSVRVPESAFRLLRGEDVWQTYHVPDEHTPATQAFSFCRKCAVHLVHAIDSDPFMVSFNVHCLTTPWKKAKPLSNKRTTTRSKKRSTTTRSPSNRGNKASTQSRGASNSQSRGTPNTPNTRSMSPPPYQRRSNADSPVSFDSKLTDSPTPPPEDEKPVREVIKTGPPATFIGKEDSLSIGSDNYSTGNRPTRWEDMDEPTPNPFALKRKPNPRFATSSSVSDWPTDTTDTSSYLYADDENSMYESSVSSVHTDPLPPTVGGTPRHAAGISSDYALREKLRSHMSKHMKQHKSH